MRRVGLVLLSVAALLGTTRARGDAEACIRASESGQTLRGKGKLLFARDFFVVCSKDDCPAPIRKDCLAQTADLDGALPSIVIIARDEANQDIASARVSLDGLLVEGGLDGRARLIDPGPHVVLVEPPGKPAMSVQIVMHEGEKRRPVELRLQPAPAQPAPTKPPAASPPSAPAGPERTHTVFPWLLTGIGVIGMGAGVAMFVVGQTTLNGTQAAKDPTQVDTANTFRALGAVAFFAGAGIVAAGLTWHFLEPTGPAAPPPSNRNDIMFAPWITPTAAGMSVAGSL